MKSAPGALPATLPVRMLVGLSMKKKRRWNGIGSFAKVVRFVSMNVPRTP
jgi:hypothetical protein